MILGNGHYNFFNPSSAVRVRGLKTVPALEELKNIFEMILIICICGRLIYASKHVWSN